MPNDIRQRTCSQAKNVVDAAITHNNQKSISSDDTAQKGSTCLSLFTRFFQTMRAVASSTQTTAPMDPREVDDPYAIVFLGIKP